MAYVSLYRKYRPQTFADVAGQDHVTRTLINAIDEGRLHHAYLFTGPRGTGKTSTARLLAKAVNCAQGPTSTPCNACDHCTEIAAGQSVDVIELDMASHGGVDDARDLREKAVFAPARARRKVYILDEVHMASTAAFNALLKLIEEPPEHVLFAMATTDPQKVLPTIMSRVQRLDLRRVPAGATAANVRGVCEREGYSIEDGAVEAVVRAGDGSLRDTQSVLEQVLSYASSRQAGEAVTAETVAHVLGHTPADRVFEAVDLLAARDLAGAFALVQSLLDGGADLRRFTLDLVGHLRDLLVVQVAPDRPDLVDATDERRAQLARQASTISRDALLRGVDVLADTLAEQRQGSPRLPLELALAQLLVPAGQATVPPPTPVPEPGPAPGPGPDPDPGPGPAPEPDPQPAPQPEPGPMSVDAASEPEGERPESVAPTDAGSPEPESAPSVDVTEPASGPEDELALLERHWRGVLDLVKQRSRRCHAVFEPATPVRLSQGILTLRFPQRYASFHAQNATKGEFVEALTAAVERACGLRVRLEAVVEGEDERRRPRPPAVTPVDARRPVLDATPAGGIETSASDEREAVEEAERAPPPATDPGHTDELLVRELDARLVEEQPPSESR